MLQPTALGCNMATVLIVDDDLGTRVTFEGALEKIGYSVETADSGTEALRILGCHPPDLLLLDLRLGDMSGLDLLRTLKLTGRSVCTVVMTGFGTVGSAVDAMKLGVVDFIEKPLSTEDVGSAVRQALAGIAATPRFDGATRWASAVARVVRSDTDPRDMRHWAALVGVAPDTLKGWCRVARISAKRSLDLARVLRAVHLAALAKCEPEAFFNVAHPHTLNRLRDLGGLGGTAPDGRLEDVLGSQRLVTDPILLSELRRVLADFARRD